MAYTLNTTMANTSTALCVRCKASTASTVNLTLTAAEAPAFGLPPAPATVAVPYCATCQADHTKDAPGASNAYRPANEVWSSSAAHRLFELAHEAVLTGTEITES